MTDGCRRLDTLPLELIYMIADYLVYFQDMQRFYIFDFTNMNSLVCTSASLHATLNAKMYRIAAAGFQEYNAKHPASIQSPPRRLSRMVKEDNADAVRAFVRFGLSPMFRMGKYSSIAHLAVCCGSVEIVRFLCCSGSVSANERYGKKRMTLLHLATKEPRANGADQDCRADVLEYLIQRTNNIDRRDSTRASCTALQYALRSGIWKFVELLVKQGADPRECVFPAKGRKHILQLVRENYSPCGWASPLEPKWRATIEDGAVTYLENSWEDSDVEGWDQEDELSEDEPELSFVDDDQYDYESHFEDETGAEANGTNGKSDEPSNAAAEGELDSADQTTDNI